MDLTFESAFSAGGMLGHASYLLLVISMTMRRMVLLRLFVIASAIVGITYAAAILRDPVSTFWESLLITTNLLQLSWTWWVNRRTVFTAEEKALAENLLPGLPPGAALRFIGQGAWVDLMPGTVLAAQGQAVGNLVWLATGQTAIMIDGTDFGHCGAGEIIGEFSAMSGAPATATVVVSHPVRAWMMDAERLRLIVAHKDATAQALEAGLSKDMRRKLERANGRVKALSGRTGRTALPVSVSDLPAAP
ncbi:MAG: cyclic nucleotide-binding domain-containing protein [Zhengella sp.]|uniref:cyclic nucleotide-binding domain-containing protein n=1 Tax=Zhengella sp. TaxID=2282762 RepID=UPI001DFFB85D|nr:cyclic nucleotide-binding domain-containing protein [Notoacmeibacter sp.]MCC0025857.1 cyclic nucleotide-binding domain-containing protein [Brucellaceae bacterium]